MSFMRIIFLLFYYYALLKELRICSPIRIFISDGGTFLSYIFFKNRSFGGIEPPEGLEIVPDILTQNFSKSEI